MLSFRWILLIIILAIITDLFLEIAYISIGMPMKTWVPIMVRRVSVCRRGPRRQSSRACSHFNVVQFELEYTFLIWLRSLL